MSEKPSTFDLLRWSVPFQEDEVRTPDRYPTKSSSNTTNTKFKEYSDIRTHQRASRIHFGDANTTAPNVGKKNVNSFLEAAKKRDLNESSETDEFISKGHTSYAKSRELVGSNIFGKLPKPPPGRPKTPERKRPLKQKAIEHIGDEIFKNKPLQLSSDKLVCDAKIRELNGNDIFSDDRKPPRRKNPPDVAAKIKQFYGTNPALPDIKASEYLMTHPMKMSDKHTSGTKIKEIGGNYDLFCGQDCLDFDKVPLGFPTLGPHPAKRKEHIGTDGYPPDTPFRYDSVGVPKSTERYHGDVKRQEMSGNYDLLSYSPNRRDYAGYVKCTPGKFPVFRADQFASTRSGCLLTEKFVSAAKRREMVGSDIFGKA